MIDEKHRVFQLLYDLYSLLVVEGIDLLSSRFNCIHIYVDYMYVLCWANDSEGI